MIHDIIKKLVDLSNTNKAVNWTLHGLAVLLITLPFWVFGDPVLGVRIGGGIYLFREAETVFMRWTRTGKLTVLEDNLGDLIGPTIVVVAVHLLG